MHSPTRELSSKSLLITTVAEYGTDDRYEYYAWLLIDAYEDGGR
jgi:hypothetical protein